MRSKDTVARKVKNIPDFTLRAEVSFMHPSKRCWFRGISVVITVMNTKENKTHPDPHRTN